MTALTVAVGALGSYMASHAVQTVEKLSLHDAKQQVLVNQIMLGMETNRSQVLQALQHNPAGGYATMHDHPLSVHFGLIASNSAQLKKSWDDLAASVNLPETKSLIDDWYAKSGGLGLDIVAATSAAVQAEKWDEAEQILIKQINPTYKKAVPAYQALADFLGKRSDANVVRAHADITQNNYLMLAVILLGVCASIVSGWFLLRSITGPLLQAVTLAGRVAQGDLSSDITVTSRNEFGQLLAALRDMNGSLIKIVGSVRESTGTIASASREIASGNLDLSSRTEQQASSLETTASSMEELTSTVKQNADNARTAHTLAVSASGVASKGGAVVAQVVDTMGSINESAKKIVDIIGVIDGIAFQTNILALNAAVEAARAGEQGRGFAVVASEVRNLAQRSAGAAKEIKTLIGDSVEKVASGARLVNQAGETMDDIVESIKRVTDIMGEITAASAEQTTGIEQINQAIAQMDEVTQQNAALVEEAAAASQSMQEQATSLADAVGVFKLDARRAPSVEPAAMPRSAAMTLRASSPAPVSHAVPKGQPIRAGAVPARILPTLHKAVAQTAGGDWEEF